ncbi:hypothetical protein EYZ11_012438 [Aspergillus tanneri]|uniref:Uncharacterized protein n=1 Tax=Aspergillus tanneri TaxID=1220188 RepID=A0A4S3J0I1_9EURO|nr:uncharacterized protein ATNIH1004_007947 [Aspergillus tanneri]KAA8646514.1 hypothetical protein ATNIH1004_007947 [Aspergillus tanneri]THC88115.1 hypothetical protein EYZ11_012438 [Aspergillus tanneri]
MFTSPTDSPSSSSNASPISQHPHPHAWFPSLPRRHAEKVRYPRYYSTPLDKDSPDSTPLHLYGLEQREPSIMLEKPKLLRRVSYALDDIKEGEKLKTKRRQSTFMHESANMSSGAMSSAGSSLSGAEMSEPPRSRPMSIFSVDHWSPPTRGLSRRLSIRLSLSRGKRFRPGQGASISQPNLIGSSTQL